MFSKNINKRDGPTSRGSNLKKIIYLAALDISCHRQVLLCGVGSFIF